MPTYVYDNCDCPDQAVFGETVEAIVSIEDRDHMYCGFCGSKMNRRLAFNGLTWAPTAGGMR